jgi:hypothetical protein
LVAVRSATNTIKDFNGRILNFIIDLFLWKIFS